MASPSLVYDKYSANTVFQSKFLNVICNQLMQGLTNQSFVDFNDHFALAGDAATCFVADLSGPIENIQFKTDERDIYIFIAKNLGKLCENLLHMETYENRIVSYFDGAYIEFYLESSITTTEHLGIYTTD